MGRRPREEIEGGIFHVYARGNRRQAIYLDDADRRRYLAMLGGVVRQQEWRCLAYCLMENHVHLLLETPRANLGIGMQWLHGLYAQTFNERHGRMGHLFQGRYGSVPGSALPRWLEHSRLLQYFAAVGGDPGEQYAAMIASG